MGIFCCPVCGCPLQFAQGSAFCQHNHRFDRARQGYYNLLQNQQSSRKRHGDDKLMVDARRAFLSKGFYDPLLQKLTEILPRYLPQHCAIADIGCGEGYYTRAILQKLTGEGRQVSLGAIDISKDSARLAARVLPPDSVAVASAFSLPFGGETVDLVLNIFAPICAGEFRRVLKKGGYLVRVVPRERHLLGLKAKIYDTPYLNPAVNQGLEGFAEEARFDLDWTVRLEHREDMDSLFKMTPYYYKTSAANQARLEQTDWLETEFSFAILVDRVVK